MPDYYQNDAEYLMDEMKHLDSMLQDLISRKGSEGESDPFKGLYLTGEDAYILLEGKEAWEEGNRPQNPQIQNPQSSQGQRNQSSIGQEDIQDGDKIKEAKIAIQQKIERSLDAGSKLNLCRLSSNFDLDDLEHEAIIICAAADLDPKYEKIYGYLHDDMTQRSPTLGLILDLLCNTFEERIEVRKRFLPSSKLLENKILEPADGRDEGLQLSTPLRLNPDVLASLLDSDEKKPSQSSLGAGMASISEELREKLKNLTICLAREKGRTICYLQGPYGSGKKEMAHRICSALGKEWMEIDLITLAADGREFDQSLSRELRKALLEDCAVFITNLDTLASEDPKYLQLKSTLAKSLESYPGLIILSSHGPVDLGKELQRRTLILKITAPDYPERRLIWARSLGGSLSQVDLDDLASKFRFTGGQIEDAVRAAFSLAALEGKDRIRKEDVYNGCRLQADRKLSTLSRRVEAKNCWEDLVLPGEKMEQLKEIVSRVRHQGEVYHDWGFGKKLSLGKGLNILFSGSSGTGKTLAAEVLAYELGLEMYKVDLSTMVSKYIGETEKNLARIFQEAEQGNAILFFDEADSIFGKRSEVKDSHDRYANLEISYLLQKMEEHEGVVIMATNLVRNMDEAFTRRMHFTVEFPFPEEEYRLRLWKTLLPAEMPVAGDVDFEFLARKLRIAGGNIKNILVGAAFLAAENSGRLTMEHLVRATGKEYRKVGMICSQSDFGEYYPLVSS